MTLGPILDTAKAEQNRRDWEMVKKNGGLKTGKRYPQRSPGLRGDEPKKNVNLRLRLSYCERLSVEAKAAGKSQPVWIEELMDGKKANLKLNIKRMARKILKDEALALSMTESQFLEYILLEYIK